uniref:Uncharacterized protein n=2 Tax=Chenopodium quinoa TaxID=63459 RepID=A0A803NDA6_CHEQI
MMLLGFAALLLRSVSVSKLIGLADWTRKEPTLFKRHLFGGRDLFGKISDFCNELKKITRVRDKEDESPEKEEDQLSLHQGQGHLKLNPNHSYKPLGSVPVAALAPGLKDKENRMIDSDNKERKPLLQVKSEGALKTNAKPKLRRNMRDDEAENIPISLNLNNVKREAKVSPIRTNPPTPQGFSATRDPIKATPSKGTKSKLMEREILQELGQKKTLRDELDENIEKSENENASLVAAKEEEHWMFSGS